MFTQITRQLMLPQFAFGALESAFNTLLARSPSTAAILRKLAGKILKIELKSPHFVAFLLFSETRCDWLTQYEGEVDCHLILQAESLSKLSDRRKLTELINNQSLVLHGDLQILQHFSALLDELEKDPAELLAPFCGDIVAQGLKNLGQSALRHIQGQFDSHSKQMTENLMNERPVLVHRLQAVDLYDQIAELAKQTEALEKRVQSLKKP